MNLQNFQIIWSISAQTDIKNIFYFIQSKSTQGAKNVINDIITKTETLVFFQQYQIEEWKPECRRIVIRNYKILYTIDVPNKIINIVRVFDARQNPDKLKDL